MRTTQNIEKKTLDEWAIPMRLLSLRDVEAGTGLSYHTVRNAIIHGIGTPNTIKVISDFLKDAVKKKT